MKHFFFLFVAAVMLATFTGCFKGMDEQKCEYDPCRFKAPATEVQALKDYLAANSITATEHCSGLFYAIQNPGTGKSPEPCSYVYATYKGMFTNGDVFDEAAEPLGFSLNRVVQGWTNGVPLVKEGGRIVLYIPPSLGYGSQDVRDQQGIVRIPGNSTLIFEVDLVAVQ